MAQLRDSVISGSLRVTDSIISNESNTDLHNDVLIGTGTAGTAGSSSVAYVPSLWTFDLGIVPKQGDVITIKIPVAGVNAGVWLSVDGGTTYNIVALYSTTQVTTHYGVDEIISLVFENSISTSFRGTDKTGAAAGTSASAKVVDRWAVLNGRDSNTTYSEISAANIAGTGSSAGLVSGRRFQYGLQQNLKAVSGDVQLYGTHLTGQVPAPAAADNGKVLQVANGLWSAESLPLATTSSAGLLSAADKTILDALGFIQPANGVSF